MNKYINELAARNLSVKEYKTLEGNEEQLIIQLSFNENWQVRLSVLEGETIRADYYKYFLYDEDYRIRRYLSKLDLTMDQISDLAEDEDHLVRLGIAKQKRLDFHSITLLSEDEDEEVLLALSKRIDLPIKVVQKLLKTNIDEIHENLYENNSEIIEELQKEI